MKITREKIRGQHQEKTSSEKLNSGHRDAITPCVKVSPMGVFLRKDTSFFELSVFSSECFVGSPKKTYMTLKRFHNLRGSLSLHQSAYDIAFFIPAHFTLPCQLGYPSGFGIFCSTIFSQFYAFYVSKFNLTVSKHCFRACLAALIGLDEARQSSCIN